MDNLTAGNPRAHAIRVYYNDTSTIYEGMPVCYNYDTDVNWFGGYVTDGVVTATTATADGSQNERRYIEVEDPTNNNLMSFAGVVKRGGWCGKSGARVLDIYVPNGAIVPVRCDVDTTEGTTILAITVDSQELGQPVSGTSRPVAIAAETETALDGGASITFATLDPNRFVYQNLDGTHLDMGVGTANTCVNEIRVESPQTTGSFCALYVRSKVSGGGYANSTAGGGIAAYFRGEVSATIAASCNTVHMMLTITGGTPEQCLSTLHVKLHEDGATMTSCNKCTPLTLELQVTDDVAANQLGWIYLEDNSTQHADDFILSSTLTALPAVVLTGAKTLNTDCYAIKVWLSAEPAGTQWYIPLIPGLQD